MSDGRMTLAAAEALARLDDLRKALVVVGNALTEIERTDLDGLAPDERDQYRREHDTLIEDVRVVAARMLNAPR